MYPNFVVVLYTTGETFSSSAVSPLLPLRRTSIYSCELSSTFFITVLRISIPSFDFRLEPRFLSGDSRRLNLCRFCGARFSLGRFLEIFRDPLPLIPFFAFQFPVPTFGLEPRFQSRHAKRFSGYRILDRRVSKGRCKT